MATNRTRKKRVPKSKIPAKISKAYRKKLKLKDFRGILEDHEIDVAKKAGVLRWDLWKKAGQVATLTGDLHQQGFRLAPVFNGFGKLDYGRYDPGTRFLVQDYEDLKAKQALK